jgi:hypothetical protein
MTGREFPTLTATEREPETICSFTSYDRRETPDINNGRSGTKKLEELFFFNA